MLNLFPELLIYYSFLGPLILRVVLGLIFIDLGFLKFREERKSWLATFDALALRPADLFLSLYALLQIIGGGLLLTGLWTQAAALSLALFAGIELYVEWRAGEIFKRDMIFYLLVFIISLSLIFTGAGARYAIDIPL